MADAPVPPRPPIYAQKPAVIAASPPLSQPKVYVRGPVAKRALSSAAPEEVP